VLLVAGAGWAQDVARMEQVIQSYTAKRQFMGSVLVAKGTEVLLNKGYGSANLEWDVPNSPATKFVWDPSPSSLRRHPFCCSRSAGN